MANALACFTPSASPFTQFLHLYLTSTLAGQEFQNTILSNGISALRLKALGNATHNIYMSLGSLLPALRSSPVEGPTDGSSAGAVQELARLCKSKVLVGLSNLSVSDSHALTIMADSFVGTCLRSVFLFLPFPFASAYPAAREWGPTFSRSFSGFDSMWDGKPCARAWISASSIPPARSGFSPTFLSLASQGSLMCPYGSYKANLGLLNPVCLLQRLCGIVQLSLPFVSTISH